MVALVNPWGQEVGPTLYARREAICCYLSPSHHSRLLLIRPASILNLENALGLNASAVKRNAGK